METTLWKKNLLFGAGCLAVTLPLYFRGLFFQQDLALFAIIALVFLGGTLLLGKQPITFNLFTDLALGLFVLFYIVTCFTGVNKNLALEQAHKYLVLYLIYLCAKQIFNSEEKVRKGLYVIVAAIALMSLISLFSAAGFLVYPGAYSASEIERWLNGTVQYHNAFGALTVMALFLACALGRTDAFRSGSNWMLAVCTYFITFGIIMSYSRGAWVLLPVLFVLYMIFASREKRVAFFGFAVPGLVSVGAVLTFFSSNVLSENTPLALVWLFGGLVLFAVLFWAFNLFLNKVSPMKYFTLSVIILIILAVLAGVLVLAAPQLFSGIIPSQLLERLSGISFGAETVQERFVFYSDAFSIAKDNLILGQGGGAWQDLYGMHQSYLYFSTQAHSYVMQVLVETGLLGLLSWFAAILLFYFMAIRAFVKKTMSRDLLAALVCGASTLIVHSFIDFDLSITAVSVLLWCMLAMMTALSQQKEHVVSPAWLGAASVTAVVSLCLLLNYNWTKAGDAYLKAQNFEIAEKEYSRAAKVNPLNAQTMAKQALAQANISPNNPQRQISLALYDKAVSLAPYSIDVQQTGISFYSVLSAPTYAMACVDKVIELQPLNPTNYMIYLASAQNVMKLYIKEGISDKAIELAQNALEIPVRAQEAGEGKLKPVELPMEVNEYIILFAKILSGYQQ